MQGERNGKKNLFSFPLPSRSLSWAKPKIVQGERNGKKNLFSFPLPSRSLSWAKPKIVQGERNGKKNLFSFPLPSRSLSWAKPEIAKTNGKRRSRRTPLPHPAQAEAWPVRRACLSACHDTTPFSPTPHLINIYSTRAMRQKCRQPTDISVSLHLFSPRAAKFGTQLV